MVRSSTGADASELSAAQICSFASGVIWHALAHQDRDDPVSRPGALVCVMNPGERLQRNGRVHAFGEVPPEIVPVATHGECRGADRAAEIEGEDLSVRGSGRTAAPSAASSTDLPAPVGPTTSVWPTSPT